jgi:polyisoprenoid-binding protein YceI
MLSLRSIWLAGIFAFATLAAGTPRVHAAVSEYTIDPARTVVSFEVRNLAGIASQRGKFNGATGSVTLDAAERSGRVDIVIDARTLEAGNEAVARFMRGESLLDVEAYPEITFRAVRIVFRNGEPQRIEGELTLRGVTKALTLTVTEYGCKRGRADVEPQRCKMDAFASFKRSEFGMTRYLTFTSDEVKLAIRTEGETPSAGQLAAATKRD